MKGPADITVRVVAWGARTSKRTRSWSRRWTTTLKLRAFCLASTLGPLVLMLLTWYFSLLHDAVLRAWFRVPFPKSPPPPQAPRVETHLSPPTFSSPPHPLRRKVYSLSFRPGAVVIDSVLPTSPPLFLFDLFILDVHKHTEPKIEFIFAQSGGGGRFQHGKT